MTLNSIWWWLGFKRFAYTNFDPPNTLIKEISPGVYTRPQGTLKTEVVIRLGLANRLRVLVSGKIHVMNVVWLPTQPEVSGDVFQYCVMPPFEKVNPKLQV
jgi:hypothetical protein